MVEKQQYERDQEYGEMAGPLEDPYEVDEDAPMDDDKWAIVVKPDEGQTWDDKNWKQRFGTVFTFILKFSALLALLYVFVCSLGLLGDAFKLLGGKKAGEAFRNSDILTNPIADLTMGIVVTVLLQSSSTTTSIVVAMVGAEVLPVGPAIYIIMGANIGTSVTNTIVSLGHAYDRDEYRRAFAGATVHDMFNWLAVFVMLPIEWLSANVGKWGATKCGLLCQLTSAIVKSAKGGVADNPELLKKITKPLIKSIIQLDKNVIQTIAKSNGSTAGLSQVKAYHCERQVPYVDENCTLAFEIKKDAACNFLFEDVAMQWDVGDRDWKMGLCILFLALALLMMSLILIVKLLSYMLRGAAAKAAQSVLNFKIPKAGWLSGYLAILVGTGLTMLLQSSSIFTSALTPLVGAGILHIKRMYPLTLGANIGTTFTAVLASLAIGKEGFEKSMQVALCHFFFNIFGIMVWYPLPFMRKVPIHLAKGLGNITSKHRWFPLVYLLLMFLCLPAAIFGLSIAGWKIALGILLPVFCLFIAIVIVNVMQKKCPNRMHPKARNWEWLPRPIRSLSYYDNCMGRCCSRIKKMQPRPGEDEDAPPAAYLNQGFELGPGGFAKKTTKRIRLNSGHYVDRM